MTTRQDRTAGGADAATAPEATTATATAATTGSATAGTAEDDTLLTGWVNRALGGFCAAALAAIAAVLLAQVVMRYGVKDPLIWVDEVTRLLMVWLTFVGAALAFRTRSHIGITSLVDGLLARGPRPLRRAVPVFCDLVVLAGSLALLVGGLVVLARTSGHTTPALQLPLAVLFVPAPLCGALVLSSAAADWLPRLRSVSKGGAS
ncbi:TRAP transporter small permease [Streptomyces sp. 4N509B]|uniref:TRAP transporter small permease n=1 Tax=Streptomyces sp. 4N509B TaxID=3457413 RepID=UPI003FCFEA70